MTSKAAALVLTLLLSGCGTWRPVTGVPPAGFPDDAVVQIRTSRGVSQLYHVHVEPDSLRGVYQSRPYSCVRCRVAIARDQVLSIRLLDEGSSAGRSFLTGFAIAFGAFWAFVLLR